MPVDLDLFHHHLDRCEYCANNPHDLCPQGREELCRATGVDSRPDAAEVQQ